MKFTNIQKEIKKLYGPVLALEAVFPHKIRKQLVLIVGVILLSGIGASFMLYVSELLSSGVDTTLLAGKTFGITALLGVVWTILFLFEAFYYSYIFQEVKKGFFADFYLAHTLYNIQSSDIVRGFLVTPLGTLVCLRCGIDSKKISDFLSSRKEVLSKEAAFELENNSLTFQNFLLGLIDNDSEFKKFLFSFSIQKNELLGVAEWIEELEEYMEDKQRWWSKENLSRIPGVGRSWSYGQVYTLQKYERALVSGLSRHYRVHSSYGVKELSELEAILSKRRDANVLLVSNDSTGRLEVVSHFDRMIEEGSVVASLRHKKIILLDNDALVSSNGTKATFTSEFTNLLNEAVRAGNIILVLDNLAGLYSSAQSLGVDFADLLEPYLASQTLHLVALSNADDFHSTLEKNSAFAEHFENIIMKDIDEKNSIKVLENEVVRFETNNLFFTYPALLEIVESAERYFPLGVMPDKAIDLLSEIVPKLLDQGKAMVEKVDILALVKAKTGIPVGEVSSSEKDKLLNLESILHKRIIGQDEAIKSISSAVRRARSGITNPKRPLGSFLFLGPTGVGKTETTKALADVFFGEEAKIIRLDMSEYSSGDAVTKLIGSFEGGREGVLSNLLREHQYGVLLLDEFEKTTKEVTNLFLQVLDEGFFSDASGKKVMARNLIIIATSNAGSDLVWQKMQEGKDLAGEKDKIIDSIIQSGVFKPELLNRFDGVVLFHPLNSVHLVKIAELMLERLHDRLAEQGINLRVDENLVQYVVSFGTDPKFGARPMNRAIQEKVEEIVARKILQDSIPKGQEIVLNKGDLA